MLISDWIMIKQIGYNLGLNYDKFMINTPGTAGGPGGRDRTLAVKSREKRWKIRVFFVKK